MNNCFSVVDRPPEHLAFKFTGDFGELTKFLERVANVCRLVKITLHDSTDGIFRVEVQNHEGKIKNFLIQKGDYVVCRIDNDGVEVYGNEYDICKNYIVDRINQFSVESRTKKLREEE